jgi:hypothetical protein
LHDIIRKICLAALLADQGGDIFDDNNALVERDGVGLKLLSRVAFTEKTGHIIRVLFYYFPTLYTGNHIRAFYAALTETQSQMLRPKYAPRRYQRTQSGYIDRVH